ncbi:MAG TPA: hypothetical protein VNK51_07065 [Bradyrhizobium sp.]|jgi:hypothetical protein|nr:hypothetical protein [Bradyrhizobium sp.]
MKDISSDSDRPNPILDYPGYYMPGFFSWLLGEIPRFGLPDWGPIPQLPRERPVAPPSRNPNLPPAHEVDPPDRPPEWLFGPPRIVQASPVSRQTVAEAIPSNTTQQSPTSLADLIIDRIRRVQQQNATQNQPSAFAAGSAALRFSSPTTLPPQGYERAEDNPSRDKSPIRLLTRVRPV